MKIIASAIKFQMKGSPYWNILSGCRHCDVYEQMFHFGIINKYNNDTKVEGFLTDKFEFLDRYEAVEYAKIAGQLKEDFSENKLYSEDLW